MIVPKRMRMQDLLAILTAPQ